MDGLQSVSQSPRDKAPIGVEVGVELWVTHAQLSPRKLEFASTVKPNITNLFPNHHMVFMLKLNQSDLYHQYLDETERRYMMTWDENVLAFGSQI